MININDLIASDTAKQKGIDNTPNDIQREHLKEICSLLNVIENKSGYKLQINSGFRCEALNTAVGGEKNSHHTVGYAADVTYKDINSLRDYVKDNYLNVIDQLIYYPKKRFIHISVHPKMRNMYFEK